MTHPTPSHLRRIADETRHRHGATHGYVCQPRLSILHDALYGAACVIEARRRIHRESVAIVALLLTCALLTGISVGALLFVR